MRYYSIPMKAGEALFLFFTREGLSMARMARACTFDRETFSKILKGTVNPPSEKLKVIEDETDGMVKVEYWGATQGEWLVELTPGEHLQLLVRRTGKPIAEFCRRTGIDPTRLSSIMHGRIVTPTENEQRIIGNKFKELRNAWRDA